MASRTKSVQMASIGPSGGTDSIESKLLGPYHLGECIGRGGFGQVYRGLNINTGVTIAVKRVSMNNLPKDALLGIESEIRLLKKLKHPNIVKYIDTIRTDNNLNIIIEYVENGSLANIVKKFGGCLPETLVAIYISQVLKGLHFLHTQGVIHRDIKGANLLATKDGLIKLADFGVATKINDSTKSDSVVGTPYWMAPEIIEMSGSQSTACDIWSVGCTVLELLTGAPPYFNLQTMPALFRIVQDEHPPLPAGLSQALEDFLLLCFQKDPNMRSKAEDLLKHPWLRSPAHSDLRAQITEATEEQLDIADAVHQTLRLFQGDLEQEMNLQKVAANTSRDDCLVDAQLASEEVRFSDDSNDVTETSSVEDWDAENEHSATVRYTKPPVFVGVNSSEVQETDDLETIVLPIVKGEDRERKSAFEDNNGDDDDDGSDSFLDNISSSDDMSHTQSNVTEAARGLDRFVENEDEDDFFEDDNMEITIDVKKMERRKDKVWDAHGDEAVNDPFADQAFDELDLVGDKDAKVAEEVRDLLSSLGTSIDKKESLDIVLPNVENLRCILRESPSQISHWVIGQGVIPLIEMLDLSDFSHHSTLVAVLELVRQMMEQDPRVQQSLCLVGLIPTIVQLIDERVPYAVRFEAAKYIRLFCSAREPGVNNDTAMSPRNSVTNSSRGNLTRQIFIACGGLQSLVRLIAPAYTQHNDNTMTKDVSTAFELVRVGVECIMLVFETPTNPKNDFCRLFCKAGLLPPLTETLTLLATNNNGEDEYMQQMLNILLIFAERGDAVVKGYLARRPVLEKLMGLLQILSDEKESCIGFTTPGKSRAVITLLKAIRVLTMEVHTRDALEQCGVIPLLVRLLNSPDPVYTNHILPSMYYLFRIKASRQEEMALCGIIPLLQRNIISDNHLKQFALPMICKLAHTSKRVRLELKKYAGVEFYLTLLQQPYWQMQAMDAISVWLADEPERVQFILCQNHNTHKLIQVFKSTEKKIFESILRSMSKIVALSSKVNQALGQSGAFLEDIVRRLSSAAAIVQKPLLGMVHLLFEKHDSQTSQYETLSSPSSARFRVMGDKEGLEKVLRELAKNEESVLVQELAANILTDFKNRE